jgi:hypothetical protein
VLADNQDIECCGGSTNISDSKDSETIIFTSITTQGRDYK